MQSILQGGEEAQSAADGLQRDATFYCVVLAGLISGNPDLSIRAKDNANAKEILADIKRGWDELGDPVKKLLDAASGLQDVKGADSLILGCTEVCMLLNETNVRVPVFDTGAIHVEAAAAFALDDLSAAPLPAATGTTVDGTAPPAGVRPIFLRWRGARRCSGSRR